MDKKSNKKNNKVKVWKDINEVVKATIEVPKGIRCIVEVMEEVPKGPKAK